MKSGTEKMWEDLLNLTYKYKKEYPYLRFGQSLMTCMFKLYPNIYNSIAGTCNDPFYEDSKVKMVRDIFWDLVEGEI